MSERESDVLDLFLDQTLSHPASLAIDHPQRKLSYGELAALSRSYAAAFLRESLHPRVLIHLPQGPDAYASMLGALMAGGYYCPVNIDLPFHRRSEIIAQFQPDVLVCSDPDAAAQLSPLPGCGRTLWPAAVPTGSPVDFPSPHELAYVIFTSGSTGRPKGVRIKRAALNHFISSWALPVLEPTPRDRWAQFANIGFDICVVDVFSCLAGGGTLVPFVEREERIRPAQAIKKHGITIWYSVPSVLDLMNQAGHLTEDHLSGLRVAMFGGEPLCPHHARALFEANPGLVLYNVYGPTETTIVCTWLAVTRENYSAYCDRTLSIGRPIPGWRIDLIDGNAGHNGEALISGDFIGAGYWGDSAQTDTAFQTVTIEGRQVPAYRSGDWLERRGDVYFFRNRIDRQVKVRGHRIELDEIDFYIREFGIRNSRTIVHGHRILAFIEGPEDYPTAPLREYLLSRLARHSVPHRLVSVPAFPRNANDKIDAQALLSLLSTRIRQRKPA
jgi:D-alanine--poly(phosphoribitol) ligase subunit 1